MIIKVFFVVLVSFSIVNTTHNKEFIRQSTKKVSKLETYTGWWVYGKENHMFKNEKTLDEIELFFLNDEKKEMTALYLAIAEMEYFPLECEIIGRIVLNKSKVKILEVSDINITYIQGCDY